MRISSLVPAVAMLAVLMLSISGPAGATRGITPGYDREFSAFLQSQGAKIAPSVVMVETRFTDWILEEGQLREVTTEGDFATGFFYSNTGIVITEYSVVKHAASTYFSVLSDAPDKEASYVLVRLVDGRQYEAEVIGTDLTTAIAVLQVNFIDPVDSPPIIMGNSNDVIVGEPVLYLGYNWITRSRISYDFGVISATRPKFPSIEESTNQYFQVNVPQNTGNAGGVVVNSMGEVIAIMTGIAPYPDATEIHFALPIDILDEVVRAILNVGEMHRPWFGFKLLEMTPQIERAYSLINDMNADGLISSTDRDLYLDLWGIDLNNSLFIVWVDDDSPAGDIGLREGDILMEFNGVPVANMDELSNQIERYRVGDRITIEWMRREYAIWDPYIAELTIEYSGQRDEEE